MPPRLSILALSLVLVLPAHAAAPLTAATTPAGAASEDYAQHARAAANALARDGADRASLEQAAHQMEAVSAYLTDPAVRELGAGFFPLYVRDYDVERDLARIYARLGRTGKALDTLEAMQRIMWFPGVAQQLRGDPAFAALQDEPRFKALLATATLPDRIWRGPATGQPYKERLTVEERIAGLSLFWAEVRSHFVHFDHVPDLDWNQVYLDTLPKVMAAETTADYYRVLMQLAPLLHDGHTNIYAPKELSDRFYARPPLSTLFVDGKVIVEAVRSPALAARVHAGDEIMAIDGVPVQRYAEDKVAPFASSSTPQDRLVRMYSYQLLMGAADAPLRLTLRDAGGHAREETVARSGYTDAQPRPQFAFRMLPGGVAYFALDHFESDAGVKAFRAALPQIMRARALVIDVRNNGGGSTSYGDQILADLSNAPIPHARSYDRLDQAVLRAQGFDGITWAPPFAFAAAPVAPHPIFAGKVAVLTGPKTFSAGEDFVLAFDAMGRGITVGEATAGSTGQPLLFALPGGGTARVCVKRDLRPNGTPFVGIGLAPGIEAHPSLASVRDGADPVLTRALVALGAPNDALP